MNNSIEKGKKQIRLVVLTIVIGLITTIFIGQVIQRPESGNNKGEDCATENNGSNNVSGLSENSESDSQNNSSSPEIESRMEQRYAVLTFDAAEGISTRQVDGISEMFATCFSLRGYTEVDRSYINRILAEQNLQHSAKTESLAVRVGRIMNVSKVVVGKVSMLGGQYQVDVKVVDVETEVQIAKDGTTVTGTYRDKICDLAKRLASKMPFTDPGAKKRATVEVLYGYLKIFPHELGSFQSEPTTVIAQINKQVQHGYNNWRIPTNEELSLMRTNNYLSNGEYMTLEHRSGIVLLVTDGDNYETVRKAEEAEARRNALEAQGFVDLGLQSSTLWKKLNEAGGFYTYEEAMATFGSRLPTKEQFEELRYACRWTWNGNGYKVTGPNGNSIVLPAKLYRDCNGDAIYCLGSNCSGHYWSSTPRGSDLAWYLFIGSGDVDLYRNNRCYGYSVRLVQNL